MEHIHLPKDTLHDHLRIPYCIDSVDYTPPFETYPLRTGRDVKAFLDKDLWEDHNITELSVDKLLQSWLFFGLLSETFDYYCPLSEFVVPSNESEEAQWISTQNLDHVCITNAEHWQELAPADYQIIWRKQARSVLITLDFLNNLRRSVPQSLVALSVLALTTQIAAFLQIDQGGNNWTKYYGEGVIEKRMIADGWCPSQVWRHALRLKPASLYILSNIRRPDEGIAHVPLQQGGTCSFQSCGKINIKPATYKTAHAVQNCPHDCQDRAQWPSASTEELEAVFASDSAFPVATYDEARVSKFLQIHACDVVPKYVAISHVWVHGLGNATNNALPRCQLRRLQRYVNELYGATEGPFPIPFWVDTISCAVYSESARERAIHKMRATYSMADKVLVLDPHIYGVAISEIGLVEALLRIQSSLWTGRLWTFQEGALAKKLYFQFKDEAVSFDDLTAQMRGRLELEFNDVMDVVSEWRVRDGLVKLESQAHLMFLLSRALRHRDTSRRDDEALCLSTLAGLDTGAIWRHKPENQRMRKFWSMLERPPTLLAFWMGDRLPDPGYRWAPATLLNQGPMTMPTTRRNEDIVRIFSEEAIKRENGIEFKRYGWLLGPWKAIIQDDFWVRDKDHGWFFVSCNVPKTLGFSDADSSKSYMPDGSTKGQQCLAIIFQNSFDSLSVDQEATASGLLVQTVDTTPVLQSEVICSVFAVRVNQTWDVDPAFTAVKRQADKIDQGSSTTSSVSQAQGNEHGDQAPTEANEEDIYHIWNRWSYCQKGKHRIFEGLTTAGNQVWCVG